MLRRRQHARTESQPPVVAPRDVEAEAVPAGGGTEDFDTEAAREINRARLAHLGSLGLPLAGRSVLEVGAGVGHLSQFFLDQGCRLVSTEARRENVDRLQRLHPEREAHCADVEEDLSGFGAFDVVFCYGLLYHLENPVRALRNMAAVCSDLLLIETVISDSTAPVLQLADESLAFTQALRGIAHRPSPRYLALVLDRIGFHHAYEAADPPDYPDYVFEHRDDMSFARDGHLLREIFVAARRRLDNPRLLPLIAEP